MFNPLKLFGKKDPSKDVSKQDISKAENKLRLTDKEKAELFEKYAFSKFDKKYFKLLNRKSDKPAEEIYPDLEYEFRHNAFVRKFGAICFFRSASSNENFEITAETLEKIRSFELKSNLEMYILLGTGNDPEKPESVFTIPLIHFKNNSVTLNSLEVFKKDPDADFFYQRDIDCLT